MEVNPADDKINILLPLVFGITVFFFIGIISLIGFMLHKTKMADLSKESHLFGVFKSVILTIIGFIGFVVVSEIIIIFVEAIRFNFFK